jgi:hypothetical protein
MEQILLNSGIEISSIVLLLLLPLAATIIGIDRQIIGFRSLGIYLSLVLTFVFYKLGVNGGDSIYSDPIKGLKYGIFLIIIVFASAAASYQLTKRWALHYYPKLSMIITNVTISILIVIFLLGLVNIKGLLRIDTFTLILIVGVAEKYVSILTRKKMRTALIITIESIVQAIFCYLIISLEPLINLLISYPYLILLLFPINYLVGKFTGLRATEYFRFRKILEEVE